MQYVNVFKFSTVYSHRYKWLGYHKGECIADSNYRVLKNVILSFILCVLIIIQSIVLAQLTMPISETNRNKYVNFCLYVISQKLNIVKS